MSSDSHTWNLVYLQLLLEELGHDVVNLGPCVPDDVLIAACRAQRPDVTVVSTVNGHGNIDGERLIRRLRAQRDLHDLRVVIGGMLGVAGGADAHAERLVDAGYDAAFEAHAGTEAFRRYFARLPVPAAPAAAAR